MIIVSALLSMSAYAQVENTSDGIDYIPVVYGQYLKFNDQSLRGLGGGLIVMSGDFEQQNPRERDNLQIVALYTRHDLQKEISGDFPRGFNNIDFLLQKKKTRHQFFSLLKSYSDKPVYGGLKTFDFVSGYGYEILNAQGHSLWLGGSLGVSDWGIETSDGVSVPVLPLPFLHYDYRADLFAFSFDFTTSPMMDFVLYPEGQFRFNASAIITDFSRLDENGMKYDLSLEYRFFDKNHEFGDFAGIRLGYQAEDYEYDIAGKGGDSLQITWNAVYATLDLSFLEITGGYAFNGQENSVPGADRNLGNGMYAGLQLAWAF